MMEIVQMKYKIKDKKYKFTYAFNTETGAYIRTGILDDKGRDTGIDPFMGSFPHLIDVGIMGHCEHGKTGLCAKAGIECYQNGMYIQEPNMLLSDFANIVKQSRGKVNQIALGGRGDPDRHEHFEKILELCRENDIVPNFTTSGYKMNKKAAQLCKKYCGAVAVSWYRSEYTINAINILLAEGVKTNIHYVLGNKSIDEAILRLKENSFPRGINAVIFLLHKPAGAGSLENVLSESDDRVKEFFKLIDNSNNSFKIGLDSCTVPGVINKCKKVISESIDTCEGGRFSCYIGSDMMMVPCSFDRDGKYGVSLKGKTIEEVWNSDEFDDFRKILKESCSFCEKRADCMGGCPIMPEIVLCKEKKF